jgi:hypothetical protein
MTRDYFKAGYSLLAFVMLGFLGSSEPVQADPSKYPQIAQQPSPNAVAPLFVRVDDLIEEIKAGEKPLIIDVRSAEEYREAHILGSLSAPLDEFAAYIASIPKDRLVVLY